MNQSALRPAEAIQVQSLTHMPFSLDRGIAHLGSIGVIVLATDNTIEHEFRQMLAIEGIAFYESRIRNAAEINPKTLAEMEQGMTGAKTRSSLVSGRRDRTWPARRRSPEL
jgi:maleate isomerase